MDRDEAIKLLIGGEEGIKQWNQLRESGLAIPHLANADLSGSNLTGVNLFGANLRRANLGKANLREANLSEANLSEASLSQAYLHYAHLCHAVLEHSFLGGAYFSGANLANARLCHAESSGAFFDKADLSGADISDTLMRGTTFRGANLRGAKFLRANLVESNLLGVEVDSATRFDNARVDGCHIYRHTLESLADYGGLAPGDRMRMRIVDGLAVLRRSYSGFMQWLHLVALTVFLFPYAWFIITHWVVARFNLDAVQVIPFWKAILRFIWNGGVRWELGWDLNVLPFSMFVVALLYNLLRLILLWKTKTLELQEQASGLPVPFTLLGWWGRLYRASLVGLYINLLAVLVHTCHFLMQEIPINQTPLLPG